MVWHAPAKAQIVPDRARAIELAVAMAEPGDSVVIAGKGHEQFQQIRDKCFAFDDVEAARRAIATRDADSPCDDGPTILPFRTDAA